MGGIAIVTFYKGVNVVVQGIKGEILAFGLIGTKLYVGYRVGPHAICAYTTFSSYFKTMNIDFEKPGQDDGQDCVVSYGEFKP